MNLFSEMSILDDLVDGEFYIQFSEFVKYFNSLNFCLDLDRFTEKHGLSLWTKKKKKVKFSLSLESAGEIYISLSQCHRRQLRDERGSESTLLNMKWTLFWRNYAFKKEPYYKLRTRSCAFDLHEGDYTIVGECSNVDVDTQAFLRVASKSNFDITVI